jgi:hypothetical protein
MVRLNLDNGSGGKSRGHKFTKQEMASHAGGYREQY